MGWGRTLLTGLLAAGLIQTCVPGAFVSSARADQDDHSHDHDRDHDQDSNHDHNRGYDRYDHRDHARWSGDHGSHDRGYDREDHRDRARWSNLHYADARPTKGDNTRDCWAIRDRIRYDRDQVQKIEPTGRHRKAMQWYKDDIQNARNDLSTCRR